MIKVEEWDGLQTNVVIHGAFEEVYKKAQIRADLLVTSPPYPTSTTRYIPSLGGNVNDRTVTRNRLYSKSHAKVGESDYLRWAQLCIGFAPLVFFNIPARVLDYDLGAKPFNHVVWVKTNGAVPFAHKGVVRFHEFILLFGDHKRLNKPMRSVWEMASQRGSDHPAPFPINLPARAIHYGSKPGDLVFDPFGGSGTTAAVAKAMNRRWLTCDTEQEFCEMMDDRIARVRTSGDGSQLGGREGN